MTIKETGTKTHPQSQLVRNVEQVYGAILRVPPYHSACRAVTVMVPRYLCTYRMSSKNIFNPIYGSIVHREKAVESCHHEYLQKLASTGIQACSSSWPFTLPADILSDAHFSMPTRGICCLLVPGAFLAWAHAKNHCN
jgi:hypothetical protein